MISRKAVTVALALLAFVQALQAALVIDNYSEATNNRYANDPAFIAGDLMAAVGRSINDPNGKWATLVSPNVVLGAHHYSPNVGDTLTFYASNDPAGLKETRTVIASQRMGDSDIWLGVIDFPLPPEYQPLAFYKESLATAGEFDASVIAGADIYMVGRNEDTSNLLANLAVGTNRIDRLYPAGTFDLNGAPVNSPTLLAVQDLPSDRKFHTTHEAWLAVYDSGGPVIADLGGVPTVIGFNWFVSQNFPVTWRKGPPVQRNVSMFSIVSNHATGIQAAIDGFVIGATRGYVDWMATAFAGSSDWSQTGPAIDFDLDGLLNFTEYAFVLEPVNGADVAPIQALSVSLGGEDFSALTFKAREDPDLLYTVRVGSDLSSWTSVHLAFDGSSWASQDDSSIVIHQQTNLGDGTWSLLLRSAQPLLPGQPRFLYIEGRPLPY